MSALEAVASFVKRPPATEAELAKLRAALPSPLPDDWLAVLRAMNGGEGYVGEDFVRLYSIEQVLKVKETLAPVEVPGIVLVGSTGGGTAYAYDFRGGGAPAFASVDFIPLLDEGVMPIGPSLTHHLAALRASTDDLLAGSQIPAELHGKEIHEVQPVAFGGDPTDEKNKTWLALDDYLQQVLFWNRTYRDVGPK